MDKYTATLYFNEDTLTTRSSNDLKHLMVSLLILLEDSTSSAYGKIVDNERGVVVQHYRKTITNQLNVARTS